MLPRDDVSGGERGAPFDAPTIGTPSHSARSAST
jgi:hypothetical protein